MPIAANDNARPGEPLAPNDAARRSFDARRASGLAGPAGLVVCVLLALLAWAPSSARNGWSFDDSEAVRGNPLVEGSLPALEAFERDYWEHLGRAGHYRPIAALSLRLDRALHGERAWGFHLTNVLLHAGVVAFAALLLLLLGGGRAPPFPWFGLALFAVHPALADSVAWISGRTSMLSALGALAAATWIAHLSVPWRALTTSRALQAVLAASLGLLFSLLSKEDAFVFAPLLVAVGGKHSRRMALLAALGCALASIAYLALRANVYGAALPSAPHAPLGDAPLHARLLVGGRAVLEALRLLAAPLGYPPNYERHPEFSADFVGAAPLLGLAGLAVWTSLAVAGVVALRRGVSASLAGSLLLCALAILPWLQWIPAGVVFAPRLLYLPLLFASPLVSSLSDRAFGSVSPRWSLLPIAVACGLAWDRAGVYESRESYWSEQARWAPHDARAHNELGLAFEERGDPRRAREHWMRAVELDREYGRPWSNLARLEVERGALEAAETALVRATELGPGNPIAWSNLGSVRLRRERFAEAAHAYRRAVQLSAGLAPAWRGLARAHFELGALDLALDAVRRALELDPADAAARELEQRIEAAAQR
jgi:Flp pilus assembly protein TadD